MFRRNAFRVLAALMVAAALLNAVTLWPSVATLVASVGPRSWLPVTLAVLTVSTALAACAIAVLLLWRAPDRPDVRALTLFLALLAVFWGSLLRFVQIQSTQNSVSVNVAYGGSWGSQAALASFLLAFAAFLRFSALFPRPLTPDRLSSARYFRPLRRIRLALLRPGVVWGTAVGILLAVWYGPSLLMRLAPVPERLAPLYLGVIVLLGGWALTCVLVGVRNLGDSRRTATPEERGRILWVVAGFTVAAWMLVAAAGMLAVSLIGGPTDALAAGVPIALLLAPMVVVASAAVGILYSGAIDPALALRRSTIYGMLGATGVVAFAVLESVLSEIVEAWVRLPGFVGPILAGGLVTAGLIPIRRAVRRWVDAGPAGNAHALERSRE